MGKFTGAGKELCFPHLQVYQNNSTNLIYIYNQKTFSKPLLLPEIK
jgi:hypothetical protein